MRAYKFNDYLLIRQILIKNYCYQKICSLIFIIVVIESAQVLAISALLTSNKVSVSPLKCASPCVRMKFLVVYLALRAG